MRATTRLRQMLNAPGIIVAPGAYDGFSARLIEAAGFPAVYMTGAGTAASHLGQPDLGLATLTEMANHAGHLASCVSLPVVADADTGYGNVLNVVRTVREYEKAGRGGAPHRGPGGAQEVRAHRGQAGDPDRGVLRQDPRRVRVPHRSRLRHHRPHRRACGHLAGGRDRPRQPLRAGGCRPDLLRGAADRGRDPPGGPGDQGAAARQHGASAARRPRSRCPSSSASASRW